MRDDRTLAVLQKLEIEVAPDPAFATFLLQAASTHARAARRRDATVFGRFDRSVSRLSMVLAPSGVPARRRLAILAAVALIAALAGALLVGTSEREAPRPFGYDGQLLWTTPHGVPMVVRETLAWEAVSPDGRFGARSLDNRGYPLNAIVATEFATSVTRTIETDPLPRELTWSSRGSLAWAAGDTGDGVDTVVQVLAPGSMEPETWQPADRLPLRSVDWSPGGDTIAVVAYSGTNCGDVTAHNAHLYVLDAQTLGAREISLGNWVWLYDLSWSPDGRWLSGTLFGCSPDAPPQGELSTIDVATGAVTELMEVPENRAVGSGVLWTPDSEWIVAAEATDEIVALRPDGSARRTIGYSGYADAQITSLSPDGRWIALSGPTPGLTASFPPAPSEDPRLWGPYGGLATVYAMSIGGGPARPLADGVWDPRPPSWTPDGEWIVFARAAIGQTFDHATIAATRTLWACRPDGSGLAQVGVTEAPPPTP